MTAPRKPKESRKTSSATRRKGGKGGKRGNMTPYEGLVYVVEEMKRNGGPIFIAPIEEIIRDLATS